MVRCQARSCYIGTQKQKTVSTFKQLVEEKHLIIIQLLNTLTFPPSSFPSSHLAFRFFLSLPKMELRHAEGSEPGMVRESYSGDIPEVREVVKSQVSQRGKHCGAERPGGELG